MPVVQLAALLPASCTILTAQSEGLVWQHAIAAMNTRRNAGGPARQAALVPSPGVIIGVVLRHLRLRSVRTAVSRVVTRIPRPRPRRREGAKRTHDGFRVNLRTPGDLVA